MNSRVEDRITVRKVSKYGVISGPYFPVFGLNTEIYFVNLNIQSEYRKMRTRNNSVSRSEWYKTIWVPVFKIIWEKSNLIFPSYF